MKINTALDRSTLETKNYSLVNSIQTSRIPRIPLVPSPPPEQSVHPSTINNLQIPSHQKVAFGMALMSLASFCLDPKTAAIVGGTTFALQMGCCCLRFLQQPDVQGAAPLMQLGLQASLALTPAKPLLPYLQLGLQANSTYAMFSDIYNQIKINIKHANRENFTQVAKNFLVYGVNAFASGCYLYNSYQRLFTPPLILEGEESTLDVEKAKKILCGKESCPANWSLQTVRKLYRQQALHAHPDKNTGSEADFVLLQKAKQVLESHFKASEPIKTTAPPPQETSSPNTNPSSDSDLFPIETISQRQGVFAFFSHLLSTIDQYLTLLPVAKAEPLSMRPSPLDGPYHCNNKTAAERMSESYCYPDEKAVAHVLGDHHVQGTHHEGWKAQSSSQLLKELSQMSNELPDTIQKTISQIVDSIQFVSSKNPAKQSKLIAEKIASLEDGKSVWLQGGWQSKEENNHAMFYEFIKRKEPSSEQGFVIDIYLYNTGEGLQYHHAETVARDVSSTQIDPTMIKEVSSPKQYFCPFVKFEGVLPEEIGFFPNNIDPAFFQHLIAMQEKIPRKDPAQEIYIQLFSPLNHRRIANPQTSDEFFLIQPQHSGTCSWQALLYAALKKHLKTDSSLTELLIKKSGFLKYCLFPSDISPAQQELCRQGGKELLLDLARIDETSLPKGKKESYRKSIQQGLDDLQESVQFPVSPLPSLPLVSYIESPRDLSVTTENVPKKIQNKVSSKERWATFSPFADMTLLSNVSSALSEILNYPGKDYPYDLNVQIERLIWALPRPSFWKDSWKNATHEEIRNCITQISTALSSYLYPVDSILFQQNTAWALLGVLYELSTRLDHHLKTSYGIFFQPFKELSSSPTFTAFSRDNIEYYQELISYFNGLPDVKLFDFTKELKFKTTDNPSQTPEETFLWHEFNQDTLKRYKNYHSYGRDFNSLPDDIKNRIILLDKYDSIFQNTPHSYKAHLLKAGIKSLRHIYRSPNYELKASNSGYETFTIGSGGQPQELYQEPLQSSLNNDKIQNSLCLFKKENDAISQENAVMAGAKTSDSFYTKLEEASCQKTLQSQLLLDHWTDQLHTLSDSKQQDLFLLSLFRSFSDKTPLYEAVKNSDFIQSATEFVEQGIRLFSQGKDRPDIPSTLFFIQVARRFKELRSPLLAQGKALEMIHSFLKRADLKDEEKNLLHMHRILEYTKEKDHLNQEPDSQKEALAEILESWILHVCDRSYGIWHQFHSKTEVVHFIYDLIPAFSNLSPLFFRSFIQKIIPESFLSFTIDKKDNYFYTLHDENADQWLVHPIQGKIFYNGKQVTRGSQKDFSQDPSYRHVFGDKIFKTSPLDSTFFFQDDLGNSYRILETNSQSILQRNFENEWYQYIDGENDLKPAELERFLQVIPKALIADHFVFRSQDNLLFVHQKTGKVLQVKKNHPFLGSQNPDFYSTVERFENPSWIIEQKTEKSFPHISFPRFLSIEGMPLRFTQTQQGISWDKNPQFLLKEPSKDIHPLGVCNNYLLIQKDKESKLLVPCKKVKASQNAHRHCDLDVEDTWRQLEYQQSNRSPLYKGALNVPQEGVYSYFEYDVKQGKATASSPEGAFFLSYLFLAQKDYEQASNILQKDPNIKPYYALSESCKKTLHWIMDHALTSYDRSPHATALALRASLILLKDPKIEATTLKDTLPTLWSTYQNRRDVIPAYLRLSKQELIELQELAPDLILQQPALEDPWGTDALRRKFEQGSSTVQSLAEQLWTLRPTKEESSRQKKFEEVYNAFTDDTTAPLNTFLKIKYSPYLWREDLIFPIGLKLAIDGKVSKNADNKKYPKLQSSEEIEERCLTESRRAACVEQLKETQMNRLYEWITDLGSDSLEHHTSKKARSTFKEKSKKDAIVLGTQPTEIVSSSQELSTPYSFLTLSLAEALHKAKVTTAQIISSFVLPSSSFTSCDLLHLFPDLQSAFIQQKSPKRENLFPASLLKDLPADPHYKTAIEHERQEFLLEYEKGLEKNMQEIEYSLAPGQNREIIQETLQKQYETHLRNIDELKQSILQLANKAPDSTSQKTLYASLRGSEAISKIHIDSLIDSFLAGDHDNYLNLNPHLTAEDLRDLHEKMQNFLTLNVQASQIDKALQAKTDHELGQILFTPTVYAEIDSSSLQRQLLVFEYRAGIKIRQEQLSLIQIMSQKKNCVTQLMMGGGKTSVIASNLLYLAATPGNIAFFIPPAAQFSTLKENLGNMQKKYFNQEVIPIQLRRKDLTVKNLKLLRKQFHEAKTSRKIILTTRETIESLVLEYLSLLKKNAATKSSPSETLTLLSSLVKEMKLYGTALVDEVDLILNPMQETNFPTGSKNLLAPYFIKISRLLFQLLGSRPELRIESNQQSLLKKEQVHTLLKGVLEELFEIHEELFIEKSDKETFLQFILGKTPHKTALAQLKARSKHPKLKESIQQISLLKHLARDVLPLTLSRNTGEHYGRVLDEISVGPYQGVNSPSFTEFGSPWEALAYHFQTVLSKGLHPSQIEEFCNGKYAAAMEESRRQKIDIKHTLAAQEFEKLTGISLLEKKQKLKEITKKLNSNLEIKLSIESDTIAKMVGAYYTYFRSTSQNFAENFNGLDSFSGTPWNVETFPEFLEENFHPDTGTEGKILDVFLERGQNNPHIYLTNSIYPKSVLSSLLEKMPPDRRDKVAGFIDSAGLFKESQGVEVAKEILDYYTNRIETVLFFDRETPTSPMVLMALKRGSLSPIVIGSTQREEIAKYGISLGSTFVYYDQTHCEATDITQKEDAINIISVNQQSIRRAFTQGILRLRSYFKGQDVEVVIPQEEKASFTSKDTISHTDVLLKVVENQAVRKAEQTFRSYKQKIDHSLRQVAMDLLIQATSLEEELHIFTTYESLFLVTRQQDLYAQFGKPEEWAPSLEELEQYRMQQESFFKTLTKDPLILSAVKNRLDAIISSAKKSPYLPAQVPKSSSYSGTELEIDVEQEVHTEVKVQQEMKTEVEQQAEVQTDIDQDLLKEALRARREEIQKEAQWTPEAIEKRSTYFTAVPYAKNPTPSTCFYSLQNLLQVEGGKTKSPIPPYHSLFSENILISHSFAHTYNEPLSWLDMIVNPRIKYGSQVLIFSHHGKLQAALISTKEAKAFQSYIEHKNPKDLWLVSATGKSLTKKPMQMTDDLQKLLWEVNLFNGNIRLLTKDLFYFNKKRSSLDKKTIEDFLKHKIHFQQDQKEIFKYYFSKEYHKKHVEKRTAIDEHFPFPSYEPLKKMGISEEFLKKTSLDKRELLLTHKNACQELLDKKIPIQKIISVAFLDLVYLFEHIQDVLKYIGNDPDNWDAFCWKYGIRSDTSPPPTRIPV